MKTCIYCGEEKFEKDFGLEHIWPRALGGAHLPALWRTEDVCKKCNTTFGLFVDGAFIKSWVGAAERAFGAKEYLSPDRPGPLPLTYLGLLRDAPTRGGECAEYWSAQCGAKIIHIRPIDQETVWAPYAGGDPRGAKTGRAYLVLDRDSDEPFWIGVNLLSFHDQFEKPARYVLNWDVPAKLHSKFRNPDLSDLIQAGDVELIEAVRSSGLGMNVNVSAVVELDVGDRFFAKVGLAVAHKLLGSPFLQTEYAKELRNVCRQADYAKRGLIPLQGTQYVDEGLGTVGQVLSWAGGWVLLLNPVDQKLVLTIISPSGKTIPRVVCDEPKEIMKLDSSYLNGVVWITIPTLKQAVGPIPLPSYIAHQNNAGTLPELRALAAKRIDPKTLPPCRGTDWNR